MRVWVASVDAGRTRPPDVVLVLVVVLVLEKAGTWMGRVCSQRLEGSRFWVSPHNLAMFVLPPDLDKEYGQQAAPGNDPAS